MKIQIIKILILIFPFVLGCASTQTFKNPSIEVTTNKVTFNASEPVEMSYKKGNEEYKYNSQAPSFLSKIVGVLTVGALGARK